MISSQCKHYNGFLTNQCCKLGISYESVAAQSDVPGAAYRLPCITIEGSHADLIRREKGGPVQCDHFVEVLLANKECVADESEVS